MPSPVVSARYSSESDSRANVDCASMSPTRLAKQDFFNPAGYIRFVISTILIIRCSASLCTASFAWHSTLRTIIFICVNQSTLIHN